MHYTTKDNWHYVTDEGYYFNRDEVFATELYMGKFDSIENWTVVSEEEKARLEEEIKAKHEEEEKNSHEAEIAEEQ